MRVVGSYRLSGIGASNDERHPPEEQSDDPRAPGVVPAEDPRPAAGVNAKAQDAGSKTGLLVAIGAIIALILAVPCVIVLCIAISVQFGGKIEALFETADGDIDTVDSNLYDSSPRF